MGLERACARLPGVLGHLGHFRQESPEFRLQPRRSIRDAGLPTAANPAVPVALELFPPRLASVRSANLLLCNRGSFLHCQHDGLCDRNVAG